MQYLGVDALSREAFYRRIHKVLEFQGRGKVVEYAGVQRYIDRYKWADELEHKEGVDLSQVPF